MRSILLLHVLAGGLGLLSGYIALYAAKGATLHRRSGLLFVCVMLTMSVTGLLISAVEGVAPAINVPSALLVFYMVITSLATVRPPTANWRWLDGAAMLMGFGIAFGCIALGIAAIAGGGAGAGLAFPLFLFGGVALAAGAGDRRVMRAGGLRGTPRLVRHLWRMCFALFVASIAFYLGPDRLPEAVRSPALRAAGVLTPIAAMAWWRWRLRARRTSPGVVRVGIHRAIVTEATK